MYYENVLSDLQRTLIPPSIPVMDVEEPWRSPMTIAGQASWEMVAQSIKGDLKRWRAELSVQVGWLAGQDMSSWGNCEVLEIDHSISFCDDLVDTIARKSRQSYNRAMKVNRRLMASSRKMATTQKRHADLVRGWRSEIISVLNEMGLLLISYRSRLPVRVTPATTVDTRLLPLQRRSYCMKYEAIAIQPSGWFHAETAVGTSPIRGVGGHHVLALSGQTLLRGSEAGGDCQLQCDEAGLPLDFTE